MNYNFGIKNEDAGVRLGRLGLFLFVWSFEILELLYSRILTSFTFKLTDLPKFRDRKSVV